ncbi:dipeptide ABC transporter ATP-binding protein [Pseudophaeobacter sp.]|uniref:ABC transporter ATP-binding protein n=1 Tax=Pseudophaeobacter sp. TaxID=1971739 RepID=UPI002630AE96|nr:dipeptide ABC transporter ATP-binding protein [Pseudophaeobacter sp.]
MTGTPSPILEIKDMTVRFAGSDTPAVEGLSLSVHSGETLAIVGESGSGKSVTSMAAMRLIDFEGGRIESGSIRLRRRDGSVLNVESADQKLMRRVRGQDVAMIFQEPMTSLNPVMKIGDQLVESILLHQDKSAAQARTEAVRIMDLVRIPKACEALERYPHEFSGGMRQRAMIAIALSCRPGLLIADEPTTALDVTIQAQILELMRDLQSEMEMGLVFITHDLGVVAEVADRVLVMRKGKMVEEASVNALFANPQADYTRQLLAAVPKLGAASGTDVPQRFDLLGMAEPTAGRVGNLQPPSDQPILSAQALNVRFPIKGGLLGRVRQEVHAVDNVSFDLFPGKTLSLVGESGSGKTTTGRSLLSLAPRTGGCVRFNGEVIQSDSRAGMALLRRHIQFVFQDPYASLDPRMCVGKSITEPMEIHGLAQGAKAMQRAAALLERVGLSGDMVNRFPHQFSGGQRQRICIARALAAEPEVIIADESVSALDVSVQAQVVNLLLDLQKETGIAMLFISHDMAVVERISHDVAVMYLGQIVEMGTRRQVFENPQHPYTQRLLSAVPVADPKRRSRRALDISEPRGAVLPVGTDVPMQPLVDIGDGHMVAQHRVGDFEYTQRNKELETL